MSSSLNDSGLDSQQLPDPHSQSRRALNQDLHARALEENPIESRGIAGEGAEKIARNIARANKYAPTKGREMAAAAYARGAEGELAVAEALKWLPGDRFVVLHDQPWPGRPKANIDHIVIGPQGIFVVDAKNWSGTLSANDSGLFQNGRDRTDTLMDCGTQAGALSKLVRALPLPSASHLMVRPVLAFVAEDAPEGYFLGVAVVRAQNLASFIGSQAEVLGAAEIWRIAQELESALLEDRKLAQDAHAKNRAAYLQRQRDKGNVNAGTKNRPTGKKLSAREARKRAKLKADFVKFLFVLGVMGLFIWKPELIGVIADTVSGWFSEKIVDAVSPE